MEMQFITKVNRRYLAIRGSTNEVGGNILETSSKNTTSERRIEMPSVTFSPAKTTNKCIVNLNQKQTKKKSQLVLF